MARPGSVAMRSAIFAYPSIAEFCPWRIDGRVTWWKSGRFHQAEGPLSPSPSWALIMHVTSYYAFANQKRTTNLDHCAPLAKSNLHERPCRQPQPHSYISASLQFSSSFQPQTSVVFEGFRPQSALSKSFRKFPQRTTHLLTCTTLAV